MKMVCSLLSSCLSLKIFLYLESIINSLIENGFIQTLSTWSAFCTRNLTDTTHLHLAYVTAVANLSTDGKPAIHDFANNQTPELASIIISKHEKFYGSFFGGLEVFQAHLIAHPSSKFEEQIETEYLRAISNLSRHGKHSWKLFNLFVH
jgi:hypothetical protein